MRTVILLHLVGNQMQKLSVVRMIVETVRRFSAQVAVADEQLVKVLPRADVINILRIVFQKITARGCGSQHAQHDEQLIYDFFHVV